MKVRGMMMAAGGVALAIVLAAADSGRFHDRPFPTGAPPGMTGGFGEPTCTLCHTDAALNDPAGALTIEGLPERYTPGQAYCLIIRLRHPELVTAGFQLSARASNGAQAGTLAAVDGTTQVQVNPSTAVRYAGHTEDGSVPGTRGAAEWPIVWTAPATGPVTFHASANAANDDRSPLGDWVYAVEQKSHLQP